MSKFLPKIFGRRGWNREPEIGFLSGAFDEENTLANLSLYSYSSTFIVIITTYKR
jgi:hypothetical protein